MLVFDDDEVFVSDQVALVSILVLVDVGLRLKPGADDRLYIYKFQSLF